MASQRATEISRRLLRAAMTAGMVAAISACGGSGGVRESFGVTLESPDAFNVYPRRPLQMPPSMAQLPAPRPGAPSPLDPRPEADAQAALGNVGAPTTAETGQSSGELALLGAAGAAQADPTIRTELADSRGTVGDSRYGLSSLCGYNICISGSNCCRRRIIRGNGSIQERNGVLCSRD